jgi:hypothetical protein
MAPVAANSRAAASMNAAPRGRLSRCMGGIMPVFRPEPEAIAV